MTGEFIYATVLGIGIGAVVRYLVPGRRSHGLLLLPAIGGVAAAALWAGLSWAGMTAPGGWIWVAALGGSAVVSLVAALLLRTTRDRADRRRLHELSGGRAA